MRKGEKGLSDISSESARMLFTALERCPLTHAEIAEALGYERPNFISMMKYGTTKIPVSVADKLAELVGLDPRHFVQTIIKEYMPEEYKVWVKHFLMDATSFERDLIELSRSTGNNTMHLKLGVEDAKELKGMLKVAQKNAASTSSKPVRKVS